MLWEKEKMEGRDVTIWGERARELKEEQEAQAQMGVIRVKERMRKVRK